MGPGTSDADVGDLLGVQSVPAGELRLADRLELVLEAGRGAPGLAERAGPLDDDLPAKVVNRDHGGAVGVLGKWT